MANPLGAAFMERWRRYRALRAQAQQADDIAAVAYTAYARALGQRHATMLDRIFDPALWDTDATDATDATHLDPHRNPDG